MIALQAWERDFSSSCQRNSIYLDGCTVESAQSIIEPYSAARRPPHHRVEELKHERRQMPFKIRPV